MNESVLRFSPVGRVMNRFNWLLVVLLSCALHVRGVHAEWFQDQWHGMGTEISIELWVSDSKRFVQLKSSAKAEFVRIERLLSTYDEASELSRINQYAGKSWQSASVEVLNLIQKAQKYSRLTGGAFDITYASVGFRYDLRNRVKPTEQTIVALLPGVNYQHIQIKQNQNTIRFNHPDTRIDLGGIGKGYAVDRVVQLLTQAGVEQGVVSAGGDSRFIGDRRGRPWVVGIKDPRKLDALALSLPLDNISVSTSGDYERFFIDEERIHHILSPKSGKPAKGVQSVTVIGPLASDTDALSTAVFVLGVKDGLDLINQMADFDAILIDGRRKIHYSNGLMEPVR